MRQWVSAVHSRDLPLTDVPVVSLLHTSFTAARCCHLYEKGFNFAGFLSSDVERNIRLCREKEPWFVIVLNHARFTRSFKNRLTRSVSCRNCELIENFNTLFSANQNHYRKLSLRAFESPESSIFLSLKVNLIDRFHSPPQLPFHCFTVYTSFTAAHCCHLYERGLNFGHDQWCNISRTISEKFNFQSNVWYSHPIVVTHSRR